MRAPAVVGAFLLAAGALTAGPPPAAPAEPTMRPAGIERAQRLLRLRDPRITESSGLAVSRRHPGVLWTVEDSGGGPFLYAVGPDGRTRATYRLDVGWARDWEALAPGGDAERPTLLIGDIGDNRAVRDDGVLVHEVAEPDTLTDATLPVRSYRLVYPDAPRDAEGLAVEPATGRLLVVSKGLFGGDVYAAPRDLRADRPNRLRRVGPAPAFVTDAAALPDGRLVVRDYAAAYVLGDDFEVTDRIPLPRQPQGETLAVGPTGQLLVGSEGARSAVWQVPLDSSGTPAARRPLRGGGGRAGRGVRLVTEALGDVPGWGVGALAVLAAAGTGLLLRRSGASGAARRRPRHRSPWR